MRATKPGTECGRKQQKVEIFSFIALSLLILCASKPGEVGLYTLPWTGEVSVLVCKAVLMNSMFYCVKDSVIRDEARLLSPWWTWRAWVTKNYRTNLISLDFHRAQYYVRMQPMWETSHLLLINHLQRVKIIYSGRNICNSNHQNIVEIGKPEKPRGREGRWMHSVPPYRSGSLPPDRDRIFSFPPVKNQLLLITSPWVVLPFKTIYSFLERGKGGRKREREKQQCDMWCFTNHQSATSHLGACNHAHRPGMCPDQRSDRHLWLCSRCLTNKATLVRAPWVVFHL